MSNKATKAPETPETTVSRATRTTEQVLKQQKADAERDRAFSPPPAAISENGFESPPESTRLIQGTILRCVDGKWGTRDGSPLPEALLALSTTRVLQKWQNNLPVETIVKEAGKELPDAKELNAKIPEDTWEKGISGPRPPWQKQYVVYLLNPLDAATYTFLNSTSGAGIAMERLEERVRTMRMLRDNSSVLPIVELVLCADADAVRPPRSGRSS